MNRDQCTYTNPDYLEFLVEYRGDFLNQINKIPYACGDIITKNLAIISVDPNKVDQLYKDVPSILFINFRDIYVLEDSQPAYSPASTSNIASIKANPYLNLTGSGTLIGIVDTGIDYLNQEFTREDGTTRIESIWDQTIINPNTPSDVFIGNIYNSDQINKALDAQRNGKDPYEIVPSKDTNGHGTHMASICGARGYNKQVEGVATDCNYVIVKLIESASFKKRLKLNNIPETPVYNIAEIIAGVEYLKKYSIKSRKPMAILIPVGSTDYAHGGYSIVSRYLNDISAFNGLVVVTGTGNEGTAETHASGNVINQGDIKTTELLMSKEQAIFSFKIYIQKPNKMTLNVISPSGQASGFIPAKIQQKEEINYIYEDTRLTISYFIPDNISGLQLIELYFFDIKPGIWKLQLKGEYITEGRYDMWLPPYKTLPEETKFLSPDPYVTLTSPSTTRKALSVAYYNQIEDSIINESGKGFPLNYYVKPDIAAPGVNILATSINNSTKVISGSSPGTAIVAGCCSLLFQWGIVDGNYSTMFATTIISYIIQGAATRKQDSYPNPNWGYGKLDFAGIFYALNNTRLPKNSYKKSTDRLFDLSASTYKEYYINNLLIRIPTEMEEHFYV